MSGPQGLLPEDERRIKGASVFPTAYPMDGLTKRELFAAMAMQGWLAGCRNAYAEFTGPAKHPELVTNACVAFADALLKELARG